MKVGREYDYLALEFEPKLSATPLGKGTLLATGLGSEGEEQTYSGKVDLADKKSRLEFIKDAQEMYPGAFPEQFAFYRMLNDLFVAVDEEVTTYRAEQEEGASEAEEEELPPADQCKEHAPDEKENPERYAAAMELLKKPDILEEAAKAMNALGHVGEWNNKKLAFACAVSARAQLPIQPSTHAQSSAGKNYSGTPPLSSSHRSWSISEPGSQRKRSSGRL